MRAKRCVRTWLGLLLGMTVTVLGTLTPSALARTNGPAPPAPTGPPGPGRAGPDTTVPTVARLWPVGLRPTVLRSWDPPATPYGRGHRGVDLAAAPGSPVRAVSAGRVSFAGRVAGRGVISVELTGTGTPPLRTTFTPVRATVSKGYEVAAGEVLGTLEAPGTREPGGSHCPVSCLHWGLLRANTYLNPLSLLPPGLLHRRPSRLLPVIGVPSQPS
ncbi:M23 family metallopeptidase [Streptomyces sp. NPDC048275]|uniref:M23 family metallopeptidase n=1 Tax=Streptomyces sp. NPDC048275 TaxID=3155629 RepID=UPI0033D12AEA